LFKWALFSAELPAMLDAFCGDLAGRLFVLVLLQFHL
jgi:hypothetical protein